MRRRWAIWRCATTTRRSTRTTGSMSVGTGAQVLDRYLPVLGDLRMRYLDDDDWTGDIVVVSHGAAIRLAAATLAGEDGSFVVEHHIGNAESVVLARITDGRWSCVQGGQHSPPFMPDPRGMPRPEELESADPMG